MISFSNVGALAHKQNKFNRRCHWMICLETIKKYISILRIEHSVIQSNLRSDLRSNLKSDSKSNLIVNQIFKFNLDFHHLAISSSVTLKVYFQAVEWHIPQITLSNLSPLSRSILSSSLSSILNSIVSKSDLEFDLMTINSDILIPCDIGWLPLSRQHFWPNAYKIYLYRRCV